MFHEVHEHAVAIGALKHYLENETEDLPENLSFYATRDEPWQAALHAKLKGDTMLHELYREDYALNRLVKLLSIKGGEEEEAYAVPMRFEVAEKQRYKARLAVNVFSSTLNNKVHQSPKDKNGKLKPDISTSGRWSIRIRKI